MLALFNSVSDNTTIFSAFEKAITVLNDERTGNACVSISGGADSDIVLDMLQKIRKTDISYVWFDTGLEFEATKRHLKYLEEKYGIKIERIRAKMPVPKAVRTYGYPFLGKKESELIGRLQSHGFKFEDRPFEELLSEYPQCKSSLKWWCNEWGDESRFNISRWKFLKEFMVENPPTFHISAGCCKGTKKDTAHDYVMGHKTSLMITGERKSEGGARGGKSSCFSGEYEKGTARFRPIFWLKDSDKAEYERVFDIRHSECYWKYKLKRTGCVGCPFGRRFEQELEVAKKYEPKLHRACLNVFAPSYEYTRQYYEYRRRRDEGKYHQITIGEILNGNELRRTGIEPHQV